MALVKKSRLGSRADKANVPPRSEGHSTRPTARALKSRRPATAIDRIDQAVQELAGGLSESAAAAAELQRALDQISSAAEEASGAAQESLGLIGNLRSAFRDARDQATVSLRRTELLQSDFGEAAAQIEASVSAISLNAQRQLKSVAIVNQLEEATATIVSVGSTVGDLSEQISMLALNASIEAVRAGEGGKGFAIVAEEVRELAESAERNANEIRALAGEIVEEIGQVTQMIGEGSEIAANEANAGSAIVVSLQAAQDELTEIAVGAQQISAAASEVDLATTEAEKGAEQIASAAEEQSAAAVEAQQAVQQQATSLDQSQQTAESLAELSTKLENDKSQSSASGEMAAAAEQLSATVQELSGAAAEIMVAVEQIARGSQIQSAATLQASVAMAQIEKSADLAQSRAKMASERIGRLVSSVDESRSGITKLSDGVSASVGQTRAVLDRLAAIGITARKIEKIGDTLALVALQTNMLAVSGAVESTRAGDAGSGFATVTADIRKLAREAAVNAEDAKDVVRTIQDQLAVIRRDLDQIAAAGEAETGRNQAMIERFGAMVHVLEDTRANNEAILQTSEMALHSTREVKSGCDQTATAAELAASAAREAGTAARQQAQGAEDLAAAIEDIAALASSLANKQN